MSSIDRVSLFTSTASSLPLLAGAPLIREIESLRKWLVRHQDEHLSSSSLFTAILSHARNPSCLACGLTGESLLLGLLEDALKMPERVIATAQKRKLLSLYEVEVARVAALEVNAASKGDSLTAQQPTRRFIVADVASDGTLTLIDELSGEVSSENCTAADKTLFHILHERFVNSADEDIIVSLIDGVVKLV
jgi:hypothetical protein